MKLIKPSFEIVEPTGYSINDIYKSIELVGRVSHKSEHNIKEDSAKDFVERIIDWGHNSCLEFGTVYLKIPWSTIKNKFSIVKFEDNKYTKIRDDANSKCSYITTNFRVILEEYWFRYLQYLCEPTEYHEKRICVKFICDRGISHELVRHRKFSFMQESTRYCNYSKDKFDNELTFIEPCWSYEDAKIGEYDFKTLLEECENTYIALIKRGWTPQEARAVLPNALKTELYMCGFVSDWKNFFKLRDDKQHAHPQAYELAHPLHEEFIKRKYL